MKEDTKKYLAIIVAVAAIVIAIFLTGRQQQYFASKIEVRRISNPILPRSQTPERTIYSIDKVKKPSASEPVEKINDLESLYKKYPEERTGVNMIKEWSKVKAEDKVAVSKGITEAIEKSEEELKVNPDDQRAKSKLVISQMLQKLIANNFNYKAKDLEERHGR